MDENREEKAYSVKKLIGHQIGITANLLRTVFASKITKDADNISPEQFSVLVCLSSGEGFCQNAIAEYVLKDDATITRILDSLEKKNLAKRKKAEHDRRSNLACLTPRGRVLVETVFPRVEELNKRLLEGIGEEEAQTAIRVLKLLRKNAENIRVG